MTNIRNAMMAVSGGGDAGYVIEGSGLFDGATGYLTWTPSGAGDSTIAWTSSIWIKRADIDAEQFVFGAGTSGSNIEDYRFTAGELLQYDLYPGSRQGKSTSVNLWRDSAAWTNIVVVWDSAASNATVQYDVNDRWRLYVNGVQDTSFTSDTYPSENQAALINTAIAHTIGVNVGNPTVQWLDAYVAEFVLLDGTASTDASEFGELSSDGYWQAIDTSGLTFGTNGFRISGGTDMAAGNVTDGAAHTITKTGTITATNDSPTNGGDSLEYGNYNTFDPNSDIYDAGTFSNGNLNYVSGSSTYTFVMGTLGMMSGVWYWEVEKDAGSVESSIGVTNIISSATTHELGTANGQVTYKGSDTGYVKSDGSNVSTGDGAIGNGDIVSIRLDLDAGTPTIKFYKNDGLLYSHNLTANQDPAQTGKPLFTAVGDADSGATCTFKSDFGQLGFTYSLPADHSALHTANMPDPAIPDPTKHFQTALVTHNGTTAAVTCNWDMDVISDTIILAKNRDATEIWYMADGLQGYDKYNQFSTTTQTTDGNVFSVSGTTLTMGSTFAANNYIVYFIKAGAAGGAANSDGSITTTVSANTTAGVSIVIAPSGTNTSQTFGHGLGVTPTAMWVKPNTGASNWSSWWTGLTGPTYDLNITPSGVQGANDVYASQGATTYGSGSWGGLDVELSNYCFTDIPGFLKTGVFEGNGDVDGSFIYCGFRPALVIIASIDSGSPFAVYDNLREGYNVDNDRLDLVSTGAEGTADEIDLLSNGFKLRIATDPNVAETSIFIAFADTPIQGPAPATNTNQGRAR